MGKNQRNEYRMKTLLKERMKLLELIGFDEVTAHFIQNSTWIQDYRQLAHYHHLKKKKKEEEIEEEEHHHKYNYADCEPKLRSWINQQRQFYFDTLLKVFCIDKLNSINFDWNIKSDYNEPHNKPHVPWINMYEQLVEYNDNDNYDEDLGQRRRKMDSDLARWVKNQRRKQRNKN